MNRIKSIESMIFQPDMVFLEVIEKKKGIIEIANGDKPKGDYYVIAAKGENVKYNLGDIVLVFDPTKAMVIDYNDKKYALVSQHALVLTVKTENFNKVPEVKSVILS